MFLALRLFPELTDGGASSAQDAGHSLTVARRLHAVQTVALHQRTSQGLVTGALRQTAPTGLTNQSGVGAEPQISAHHGFLT